MSLRDSIAGSVETLLLKLPLNVNCNTIYHIRTYVDGVIESKSKSRSKFQRDMHEPAHLPHI